MKLNVLNNKMSNARLQNNKYSKAKVIFQNTINITMLQTLKLIFPS